MKKPDAALAGQEPSPSERAPETLRALRDQIAKALSEVAVRGLRGRACRLCGAGYLDTPHDLDCPFVLLKRALELLAVAPSPAPSSASPLRAQIEQVIAKWREEQKGYNAGATRPVLSAEVNAMNRASASVCERFVRDLDALLAESRVPAPKR